MKTKAPRDQDSQRELKRPRSKAQQIDAHYDALRIPTHLIVDDTDAKVGDFSATTDMLQSFGQLLPVIVERRGGEPTFRLRHGHAIVAAARSLGWPQVAALVLHCDITASEELQALLAASARDGIDCLCGGDRAVEQDRGPVDAVAAHGNPLPAE